MPEPENSSIVQRITFFIVIVLISIATMLIIAGILCVGFVVVSITIERWGFVAGAFFLAGYVGLIGGIGLALQDETMRKQILK